ncbi:hypothetical protein [Demequina sp. NBRC 110056]|nr:hypothetical protein [Demequina sp. NBRC 110056]
MAKNDQLEGQPLWTVPAILGILMLSAGGMFLMIAQGIAILSGA